MHERGERNTRTEGQCWSSPRLPKISRPSAVQTVAANNFARIWHSRAFGLSNLRIFWEGIGFLGYSRKQGEEGELAETTRFASSASVLLQRFCTCFVFFGIFFLRHCYCYCCSFFLSFLQSRRGILFFLWSHLAFFTCLPCHLCVHLLASRLSFWRLVCNLLCCRVFAQLLCVENQGAALCIDQVASKKLTLERERRDYCLSTVCKLNSVFLLVYIDRVGSFRLHLSYSHMLNALGLSVQWSARYLSVVAKE